MKLSVWARQQGVSYKTPWRMWRDGRLPVPAEQLATGTVVVHAEPSTAPASGAILYARVSSADQREDLVRQLERLRQYAEQQQVAVLGEV